MSRKLFPWIGALVLVWSAVACGQAQTTETTPVAVEVTTYPAEATMPADANDTLPESTVLSPEEQADLLHMREEEKLARDVYLTLYEKWQLPVFQNIARSEQTHMDAVAALLPAYGLEDPVAQTGDERGVFTDPDLQALYDQLVEQGSASIVDALTVGATIEDLDIKDLNEALGRTDQEDIRLVYENLKKGSENHMRAFVSNLQSRGADYTPQYISEAEYQAIVGSAVETDQGSANP